MAKRLFAPILVILTLLTLVGGAFAQPTSPLPPFSIRTLQIDATADGDGNRMNVAGLSVVGVTITTIGSPTFTVNFEVAASEVAPENTPSAAFRPIDCQALVGSSTSSTASAAGSWRCNIAGFSVFQARISGYSGSGSIRVIGVGIPGATASSSSGGSATPDVTDRAARLLGIIYGSQGQQLKQTATNFNTQVELAVGAGLIDPRSAGATQVVSATLQNAATADGNGSTLNVAGMATAAVTVDCNTCSGGTTVEFEGTEDGSKWDNIVAYRLDGSERAALTTTPGVSLWRIPTAGLQSIRTPVSSYSAGTVTVTARAVPIGNPFAIIAGGHATNSTNTSDKLGVLPAIVGSTPPSYTDGRQVTLRVRDDGSLVVSADDNGMLVDYYPGTGAANQDSQQIKGAAGVLYTVTCTSIDTTVVYVKLYEVAAPTSGSTVKMKLALSGAPVAGTVGGGHFNFGPDGIAFATAMGSRYTTGFADTDANAVTTGEVICHFGYR